CPATNDCGTTYVTAAPDDGVAYLRQSTYACVTPDHRVLDAGAFFDIASATQDRVDDLRARFDRAFVGDHREFVDFCVRSRIKCATPILYMNTRHAIREQIKMRLVIARGRANVHPVASLRDVCEERFAFLQQLRKEPVFE